MYILWSRFGTPLSVDQIAKPDGSPYLSALEWEYEDAIKSAQSSRKPIILVYRRTEQPKITLDSSDVAERVEQYDRVKKFFNQFVDPSTGTLLGSVNEYRDPQDFRNKLERPLTTLISQIETGNQ